MPKVSPSPKNAACGAALGTNAKLRAPTSITRQTERFALQSVARQLLPKSRTSLCLRARAFGRQGVDVLKSKKYDTAHYAGLQTCGSVWTCPVCAAKIAERRRLELQSAMSQHQASSGSVQLLTLTTPHTRFDKLEDLMAKQAEAVQSFLRDKTAKKVFAEMGYIGQVRALEVTHGRKGTNNGWHPHFHFLQFVEFAPHPMQLDDWKLRLFVRWASCCKKAGLSAPTMQHGLDIRDGSYAEKYVSKWGLEDEMTKAHIKKGRAGGETPFDLLRSCLVDAEDRQAAFLFKEFAANFKRKHQLSWSNGLKAKFDLVEKTDEELSEEKEDEAYLLGQIDIDQWRDVLKVDARGIVLELASLKGWTAVENFLFVIKGAHDPQSLACELTPDIVAEARTLLLSTA